MNNYNLYLKIPMNREDCIEQTFKEIKLIRNDGSELISKDFYMELDPTFFVAEGLLGNREHLVTEQLKPLFVEKREELIEELYSDIGNNMIKLADNMINNFIKENENE